MTRLRTEPRLWQSVSQAISQGSKQKIRILRLAYQASPNKKARKSPLSTARTISLWFPLLHGLRKRRGRFFSTPHHKDRREHTPESQTAHLPGAISSRAAPPRRNSKCFTRKPLSQKAGACPTNALSRASCAI